MATMALSSRHGSTPPFPPCWSARNCPARHASDALPLRMSSGRPLHSVDWGMGTAARMPGHRRLWTHPSEATGSPPPLSRRNRRTSPDAFAALHT